MSGQRGTRQRLSFAPQPFDVRLSYWVEFLPPSDVNGRWWTAMRDESEDKAWAAVRQLRCWSFAHRVSITRHVRGEPKVQFMQAGEWDREGNLLTLEPLSYPEFPSWLDRSVTAEDRVPFPTRG